MSFEKIVFLLVLTFLIAPEFSAQKARQNNASAEREKEELIQLTKELSRASVEKDAATLERLMDDKFVLLGVSNKYFHKAELIKLWTESSTNPQSAESSVLEDFQVFLYGKTAIVISTITDTEKNENGETVIKTKAFDVWKKTKKGWRWIASRETLLPPDKK